MKPVLGAAVALVVLTGGQAGKLALEIAGPSQPQAQALKGLGPYDEVVIGEEWATLIEEGDTYLMANDEERARQKYLAAFTRARRQGSLDGMLRVADAFAGLQERQMVEKALAVAQLLAAQEPEARADVRAAATRLGEVLPER